MSAATAPETRRRSLGRLAAVTLAIVGIIALPGFTVPPSLAV